MKSSYFLRRLYRRPGLKLPVKKQRGAVFLGIAFVLPVLLLPSCRDQKDLSPRNLKSNSCIAIYVDRSPKAVGAGTHPICIEFWMEGNDADVKEAGEALRGFMTFAGEGTHVASCAAYREKALWACREESDLSRKNSSDDPLILKNISRIYTITYYLGADRKTARRQCNSASDFDRAEFIDFHQKR